MHLLQRFAAIGLLIVIVVASCNCSTIADTGDQGGDPPANGDTPNNPGDTPEDPADEPVAQYTTMFSPNLAWDHLVAQVDLGYRVPGTKDHVACRRYLEQVLGEVCDEVETQEFEVDLPSGVTQMWNIIGRFNVDAERRILLGAHWDTRPTADHNPVGQRDQPIAGANDGASGVAVLLELARVFSLVPPPVGVDIVLFDGEDYGPSLEAMFFGSKHFAHYLLESEARSYNYGILLDMIGDKQLDIHPENNSESLAGFVYAAAYHVSQDLGYSGFKASGGYTIIDDHVFIQERGIRMYDFIDFNFPDDNNSYWHTTNDTVDACSRDSLECVGRTVENLVYLFPNLYAPE